MKILYIQPHLGLGDSIVCNAIVRELATRHDLVIWPAKWHNRQSVAWMWRDVENVKVIGVEGDAEASEWSSRFERGGMPVLRLGMFGGKLDAAHWGEQMYEQAGVSWVMRWDGFQLPMINDSNEHYDIPIYHHDPSRGFNIDAKRLPTGAMPVAHTDTIWHNLGWLQVAPEVHVIDSCFLCLADSVPTAGKLVFHKYATAKKYRGAGAGQPPTLRKDWTVLE